MQPILETDFIVYIKIYALDFRDLSLQDFVLTDFDDSASKVHDIDDDATNPHSFSPKSLDLLLLMT